MAKRTRKLKWDKANYKDFATFKIPASGRQRVEKKELYPVEIIERNEDCVRVHYIGYKDDYDEWKDVTELESLEEDCEQLELLSDKEQLLESYSLYKDLSIKIKKSLSCNRRSSPRIKIVMPFDVVMFNGGLKASGNAIKVIGGNQHIQD